MKPLCIDLFCGLGGWTEGFLAEGYTVIGFDNHRHEYGEAKYPGQLVIQDVLTIHGSQFKDAAVIVASPPCQNYSYLAMPWSRSVDIVRPCGDGWEILNSAAAKEMRAEWEHEGPDNRLFDACFRIQREANIATGYICESCGAPDEPRIVMVRPAGYGHSDDLPEYDPCPECLFKPKRFIPLIVENVRGAIPWVGRSAWNYGSFHLWGDVPALMPFGGKRKGLGKGSTMADGTGSTSWFFSNRADPRDMRKAPDGSWVNPRGESLDMEDDGTKIGGDWFGDPNSTCRRHGSRSQARKAASAKIAKIPPPLSVHIAQVYKPRTEAAA